MGTRGSGHATAAQTHRAGGGRDSARGGQAAAARKRLEALTEREREVVAAVAQALSNAEIGRRLFMSEVTVKAHVSRVLAKLGMSNRVQAGILAHDAGLLDQRLERGWPPWPWQVALCTKWRTVRTDHREG